MTTAISRLPLFAGLIASVTLFWCSGAVWAEETQVVRYFQTSFRYEYRRELLQAVLKVTESEYGAARLEAVGTKNEEISQARGLKLLDRKSIDVVFLPTSREREKRFLAVRVPLIRGLLGFRLIMIKKSSQQAFSRVSDIDQLRNRFIAGFNPQWADYPIFKANNLPVVSAIKYDTLFSMLENNRFDYIPRGVNEIWAELTHFTKTHPTLVVENNLAFYYPQPVYFFVGKGNTSLAKRLKQGLDILTENGQFNAMFEKHFGELINKAKINSRYLFQLTNPSLPDDTPVIDVSWWLSGGEAAENHSGNPSETTQ